MDFDTYQEEASRTDRAGSGERGDTISHFGLIGEIGSLLTVFKKRLRDQSAYSSFNENLKEELGDVLWYLSNICTRYGLSMDQVARDNLDKVTALWGVQDNALPSAPTFDSEYPISEQLPREFEVEFCEEFISDGTSVVRVYLDGTPIGDPLTDNAYEDDGYRYHDIFHISYAVFLGWSPLLRKVLGRKRKSDSLVDEVEDGARARIAEEAVSLYVYGYALDHSCFDGVATVDTQILRGIRTLVDGLEVQSVPYFRWKMAILEGYRVFRELRKNRGGKVRASMPESKMDLEL